MIHDFKMVKIVNLIKEDISTAEICRRVGLSRSATLYRLGLLEAEGIIKHRTCTYEVTEYGETYFDNCDALD